jgi:photosystem II stability/assembly factor-like uncharacterized protein
MARTSLVRNRCIALLVVATAFGSACGGDISRESGSRADAPIAMPVTCSLSASDVGAWHDITPEAFRTPSNMETWSIAVNPHDATVYAAAGNITNGCGGSSQPPCVATGVYKSSDCGGSWILVSTGRSAADLTTGDPWALRIDPDQPQNMYINNGYGRNPTLFRSTNGGVDWDPLVPDVENALSLRSNFVQAVGMDPGDPKHLVITFHDSCTSKLNGNCLSETTNGGDTWRELSGPPELTGWAEASSITVFGPRAYLLTSPAGAGGGFYTSDGGTAWAKVVNGPAYGSYGGGAHIASDGNAYLAIANTGVFVSTATPASPLGASWSLIPGSKMGSVVFDDGVNLYVTWGFNGSHDYFVAPLAGLTSATPPAFVPLAPSGPAGANMLDYDAAHHILYAAAIGSGVWRFVTR